MKQYFLFELKAFSRSTKNIAVMILLVVAALYYSLFLAPNYRPNESINESEIQSEQDSIVHWIENRESEGVSVGAQFALAYYPPLIEINSERLEALEEDDFKAYSTWTAEWYIYQDMFTFGNPQYLSYNYVYYGIDQEYPLQEGSYWYRETANRYAQYAEEDSKVSPAVLEERTALQTVYRLLNTSSVPVIMLAVVVFYANDSVVKDRKHLSITKSFPVSFSGKLWTKTLVVLTMTAFTFIGLLLIFLVIIGYQEGFGSFSLPISVYDGLVLNNRGSFDSISLGRFYIQAAVLIFLITYIFVRAIILLSVLVRNEFFNLFAGIALIFSERIYYMRGIGFFSNVDLLPPTYFPIGEVLTGYQNHLYNSPSITFQNGVYSLAATIVAVEIILFVATRFKRIRNFI